MELEPMEKMWFFSRKHLTLLPHYHSALWLNLTCSKVELSVKQSIFCCSWVWRKKRSWWAINIRGASRIYAIWWSVFCRLPSALFYFSSFLPFPVLLKPFLEKAQLCPGKSALWYQIHQHRLQAAVDSSLACNEASSTVAFITHSEGCWLTRTLLAMLAASCSHLETK